MTTTNQMTPRDYATAKALVCELQQENAKLREELLELEKENNRVREELGQPSLLDKVQQRRIHELEARVKDLEASLHRQVAP